MLMLLLLPGAAKAQIDNTADSVITFESITEISETDPAEITDTLLTLEALDIPAPKVKSYPTIYSLPYSMTLNAPDWRRLWINTGVLTGAFVSTLLVLEMLPEDATAWNRSEIQSVPPFKRWWRNIFVKNPEWDHDKFIFNWVLHPYAGAAYFMTARSCGFNFWRSLLYCSLISTVGWEFGIEAFMERPSYQDLWVTPLIGSAFGELFYKLKRHIVNNNYSLGGSKFLGNVVAVLADPVNEVIGVFAGNPARKYAALQAREREEALKECKKRGGISSTLLPFASNGGYGFTVTVTF